MKQLIFIIIVLFIATGCEKILFMPEKVTSPENVFEVCWNELNNNYSYFTYKKLNWDSIHNEYAIKVIPEISENSLFYLLSNMLKELHDRHVNIFKKDMITEYNGWYNEYPISQKNPYSYHYGYPVYLENEISEEAVLKYAKIKNYNIGYIFIESFAEGIEKYEDIDKILDEFKNADGLIIDVRSNGGGYMGAAETVAKRFINITTLAWKWRFRNGYSHNDFTEWFEYSVEPFNADYYSKPVVVLTNRGCASATELFILCMRNQSQVTVIGDTTLGLVGIPLVKELPNGWIVRFSNSQTITPDEEYIESIGISPDITLQFTEYEKYDLILEKAIETITNEKFER